MTTKRLLFAFFFSLVAIIVSAQQPPSPNATVDAIRDLEHFKETQIPLWMNDYGNLARFREDNAKLGAPAPQEQRVVFMGDSITQNWQLAKWFPGKPYVNRGISAQTTRQMLLRFRADVVQLQPKVVVILAGTNDIAGNTGPMTVDEIIGHLTSMAELAKANGIRVVLSSVTPVSNYTKDPRFYPLRSPQEIRALNTRIKDYCARSGCVYLDYFSAMVDEKGMLKADLAEEGLHPNDRGFAVMSPLAEKAIEQALAGDERQSARRVFRGRMHGTALANDALMHAADRVYTSPAYDSDLKLSCTGSPSRSPTSIQEKHRCASSACCS